MVAVNYNVQYINQYGAVVRDVEKIGTVGDTVSVTPNQLAFGFQIIVADPKSLTLEEDATKNVVKFDVIQDMNDFTIASRNLSKKVADGDAGLDRRLKVAEKIIVDKNLDLKTLWTGSVTAGNIQISGLKPDFSNCKALLFEAGLNNYFFDDSLLWSSYPLRINVNTLVLSSPQPFYTKLANTKIFGSSQHYESDTNVHNVITADPHELTKRGHIEIMVNNNNNLTIASTPMTFLYGSRGNKVLPKYYDVPLYVKKISYIPK